MSTRAPALADVVGSARSVDPTLLPVREAEEATVRFVGPVLAPALTAQYSLAVHDVGELRRLAPEAVYRVPIPAAWTQAWAAGGEAGEDGVRVARLVAERCGGVCLVEDGTR